MGTINYKTSDFITLGYNCNNINYDDEFYHEIITDCYDQINHRLKQKYFSYFAVTLEPGYYEGFSLDIKFDFLFLDNWEDKRNAQREITEIKAFLLECINDFECVAVYPGWCTGYANYKETLKELSAAIWEMRQTVKNTPTYAQYRRNKKCSYCAY